MPKLKLFYIPILTRLLAYFAYLTYFAYSAYSAYPTPMGAKKQKTELEKIGFGQWV